MTWQIITPQNTNNVMIESKKRDEPIELCWWHIGGYYEDDYQARLFRKLEKQGMSGLCIVNESPFESRRIKQWIARNRGDQKYHFGNRDCVEYNNSEIGYYKSYSRCVWMFPEMYEKFKEFLSTLPPRPHKIKIKLRSITDINPSVGRMIRGLNYLFIFPNRGYEDDGYALLSIQDFKYFNDQFKVLIALS